MRPRRILNTDFSSIPVGFPYPPDWRTLEDRVPSKKCTGAKWKSFLKKEIGEGILFYHSKSTCGVPFYLSNLTRLPTPLKFMGRRFRTAEHAFQSSKYMFTTDGARPYVINMFTTNGEWGDLPGGKVKGKGGKGEFSIQGAVLDMKRWEKVKVGVMKEILEARSDVDPLFRDIVARAGADGVTLIHYETTRGKGKTLPFWGVKSINKKNELYRKGGNTLGKLLMKMY